MNRLKTLIKDTLAARGFKLQRISLPGQNLSSVFKAVKARNGSNRGVVIDVGAHKGLFVKETMAAMPAWKIVAFEPNPVCYRGLCKIADDHPELTVLNCGLGSTRGTMTLNVHQHSDSSSILSADGTYARLYPDQMAVADQIEIEVSTLDDWASGSSDEERVIDLVKLDVQGYELEVILGAEALFKRTASLIVEAALTPAYQSGVMIDELCHELFLRGFRVRYAFDVYPASLDLFLENENIKD